VKEKDETRITRRNFIKTTGASVAATSIGAGALIDSVNKAQGASCCDTPGEGGTMQKRVLGETGEELSIVGFGGIVVCGTEQPEANAIVKEAVEKGINYFDVAPSYCNGEAEERLGPALEPFRKDVFLACKTARRDKAGAQEELEQSLKRLKTDYFDLYQLHAMTTEDDFNKAMGPGGAMEVFEKAREKGMVRYLGFSAHSAEIAVKLMDEFDFDSVLFPINWVCTFNGNFGPQVIEKAKEKGVGRLALKAMAKTTWKKNEERDYPKCWYRPVTGDKETDLAMRFTLSQPITAAIPPGDIRLFRKAMDMAPNFQPLTDTEHQELKQMAQGLEPIFKTNA
jgi:aryl-alcohol dehydrogenase-like predicted oxidoreductase